jgi:hypothetical protein
MYDFVMELNVFIGNYNQDMSFEIILINKRFHTFAVWFHQYFLGL